MAVARYPQNAPILILDEATSARRSARGRARILNAEDMYRDRMVCTLGGLVSSHFSEVPPPPLAETEAVEMGVEALLEGPAVKDAALRQHRLCRIVIPVVVVPSRLANNFPGRSS
jgi:hypothetical protein